MIAFDNSYFRDLAGFYVPVQPQAWADPKLVLLNARLAQALGLDAAQLRSPEGVAMLTGHAMPEGAQPLAQAYAGHQFGGFSPQLGDGRAMLVGEWLAPDGARYDLHLKGSGRTPFARGGDGRAVLGPVLREYLISEAMAALGVSTTRALAACTTGDRVMRQFGLEPGAVLARVASSHLRVGTFQFFAVRGERDKLGRLLAYAIARHDPDLIGAPDAALQFLARVGRRQIKLVAQWMGLGFVHGVMNTDNTTISGETIDYGPCAFMDAYDPATVFSSIDQDGRYAYGNQPAIIFWNLARLAETLLGLIDADADRAVARAGAVIADLQRGYRQEWLQVFARKLGIAPDSEDVIDGLDGLLAGEGVDFTQFFCALSAVLQGDESRLRGLFKTPARLDNWLASWRGHVEDVGAALGVMRTVNPIYIPRNHLVEEVLMITLMEPPMIS